MVGTRKRRPGERTDPEEEKPVTREEDGEEVIAQKREACRVIDQVKVLIEECLMQYMNKEEVLNDLCTRKGVDRGITETVWEKLVQDNSEFFQQYYAKTMLKKQILCYKYVLEKQVRLTHERFQSAAASSTYRYESLKVEFVVVSVQSQPENTMRHGSNSAGTSYMVGTNNQQSPMIHDEFPALVSTHVGRCASVPTARVPKGIITGDTRAIALEELTGTARVSDNSYMNNLGSGFPEGNLMGRPSFTGNMLDASFNPELVGQHYSKQFLDANISSGYSCQGSEGAGGIPPPHVTQFASASAANYQPCAQNPENMITHGGGIFTDLAPAHVMGNSAGMQASENPFGGMLHEVVGGGTMSSPCYPSSFDFGDAAVPASAMEASAPMLRSEPPNTGMLLHEPGGRGVMSAPFYSSSSGFANGNILYDYVVSSSKIKKSNRQIVEATDHDALCRASKVALAEELLFLL
ncbi:unnamed protein product [Musa acuminata subsp. malaccensis]|uniref:(wild Malaysian banana) hypothetical protein n=1 Tax=Musa acuminata subsp. malaccensis TaxID=214687 RepID=A0A804KDT4_MUSAM|nr:unnamed protein product [Musa acuminata subsp. malaccensis]